MSYRTRFCRLPSPASSLPLKEWTNDWVTELLHKSTSSALYPSMQTTERWPNHPHFHLLTPHPQPNTLSSNSSTNGNASFHEWKKSFPRLEKRFSSCGKLSLYRRSLSFVNSRKRSSDKANLSTTSYLRSNLLKFKF